MFEIGSTVLYGSDGLCRITQMRRENFSGQEKDYYILSPTEAPSLTIYVPTDSAALTARMHPLMTREEWINLLNIVPHSDTLEWIRNPRERSEMFRKILEGGNRERLFQLVKTIYERRKEQAALGRKLYSIDEQVFAKAEKLLHSEIAEVLHMEENQVRSYLMDRLCGESS